MQIFRLYLILKNASASALGFTFYAFILLSRSCWEDFFCETITSSKTVHIFPVSTFHSIWIGVSTSTARRQSGQSQSWQISTLRFPKWSSRISSVRRGTGAGVSVQSFTKLCPVRCISPVSPHCTAAHCSSSCDEWVCSRISISAPRPAPAPHQAAAAGRCSDCGSSTNWQDTSSARPGRHHQPSAFLPHWQQRGPGRCVQGAWDLASGSRVASVGELSRGQALTSEDNWSRT